MESEQQIFPEKPIETSVHSEEKLKSAWQLFKEAWSLYRSRLSTWIGILLVPTALSFLLTGMKYVSLFPPFSYMPLFSLGKIIIWVLFLFFNIIATSALFFSIKLSCGVKESYVVALRNWFPYVFLSAIVLSISLGGFVFLLVPGMIFLVWFALALPVFVFEEKGGMEALLRSKRLVSGNFWKVAWRSFFIFLLLIVMSVPFAVMGKYIGDSHGFLFIPLVFITVPMMTLYSWFLYQDLVRIDKTPSVPTSNRLERGVYWFFALIGLPVLAGYILFQGMLLVTHDIPEPDDSDLQLPVLNIPREQNAYYVFSEIGEDEIYWPTDRGNLEGMLAWENWDDTLAQEILQKNAHALDVFERGVALPIFQQPEFQDPKNYNANQIIPSVAFLRNLAKVNALKSTVLQREGREEEAMDQSIKTMAMAKMLQDSQGSPINYLLGVAVKEMGLSNFRELVRHSNLQSSELLPYRMQLEEYKESKASLQRMLRAEYVMFVNTQESIIDSAFYEEEPVELLYEGELAEDENEPLQGVPHFIKVGGFFYYQSNKTKLLFAELYRGMIRNAEQGHYGLVRHAEKMPMNLSVVFQNNAIGKILSNVVSISFDGLYKRKFQETFSVKATQSLLALKAYEQDRGVLPNSLEELVPAYLPEVPQDPFDGKQMRYVPERRIIYSTGEDLVDDGGDIDEENWQGGKDIGFMVR